MKSTCINPTSIYKTMVIILWLFLSLPIKAQAIDPIYLQSQWKASWIMVPNTNPKGYGVYLFRKSIELTTVPKTFPVYVSADNRYKLYVNEKLVSLGPAKSDLQHWKFEMVDLAPYLTSGKNIISSKVWNEAESRPEFQISFMTGFILEGGTEESQILNTGRTWKCIQDSSYSPILISMFSPDPNAVKLPGWYIAGPGEKVDMHREISGWEKLSFDDSKWGIAKIISAGTPKNAVGLDATSNTWLLVPSTLPQMELKKQKLEIIRRVEGISMPKFLPTSKSTITIPANTSASILIDQAFLTNAFPTLIFSDGENSRISLTYAESLYNDRVKGNRNEIDGKMIIGRKDIIVSNGSKNQNFTTLAYRTYRYIEIKIETKDTPLVIEDFYGTFIGYPFKLNAKFETDVPELNKMMEIGWRTARLCANETYMDTPYWEQLQYIGDTRIQAMVSLYNSGDDRLIKNALDLIDYSRQSEGVTLSRYPTVNTQIIPTFSLWYIGMLHDYMMYGVDSSFVKDKLPGERQILNYFKGFQATDGSLKNVPNWFFTDWVDSWQRGKGPVGKDGSSAMLDLQLLLAYQTAGEIEHYLGMKEFTSYYKTLADLLSNTIKNKYWDDSKKLFADTPEKNQFSQHANSLAILTGLVTGKEAENLGKLIQTDTTITQVSIYFKYYVHQALVKAGLGNDYISWLDIWRKNIKLGLTTWGEDSNVETTRSDCHAWGASPNIEFFRTILGIDSDAPGFSKVRVEPHLGPLLKAGGEMPHPNGKIAVNYKLVGKEWKIEINLPEKTTGRFIWKGKSYSLNEGVNMIKI
jgi:alpha-L-rhamnosidase